MAQARPRLSKTCSLCLVTTPSGKVLKPVVTGRSKEFGEDAEGGWKLDQMRAWEVPGLAPLGDYVSIHSNESRYFHTETYSDLVLDKTVVPYVTTMPATAHMFQIHDASSTHAGELHPRGRT